jgi:hypothetical protein
VVIPNSVTTIGSWAFANCSSLYDVYFESEIPPSVGSSAFQNVRHGARAIVPYGATAYGNEGDLWHGLIVTYAPRLYGDVDNDGMITAADVTMLRRWIAAGAAGSFVQADFEQLTGINLVNARVTNNGVGLPGPEDVARLRQWLAAIDKNSVPLGPQ